MDEMIKIALFRMLNEKAPRLDGLTTEIFKFHGDIFKLDLIVYV